MLRRFFSENRIYFYVIIVVALVSVAVYFGAGRFSEFGVIKPEARFIPIHGQIYLSDGGGFFSSTTSAESIVSEIEKANNNQFVGAIILDINSGGGSVVASKEISAAVEDSEKPVVAWLRETSASGAYWIAASCDVIVSDPATITGSIGVIGSYLQFSDFLEDYGIEYERLVSGEYKDTGSPYKELSSRERNMLQEKIDIINGMFLDHVAEKRGLDGNQIEKIDSGEVFLGVEAKELGLVDVLGSKNKAVNVAEELADQHLKVKERSEEPSFIQEIINSFSMQSYLIGRGIGDSIAAREGLTITA